MERILHDTLEYAKAWQGQGSPATFIPELTRQDPNLLGISLTTCDGQQFSIGDCSFKFTIQSISKLILLAVALEDSGFEKVFSRVGMEPSGDRFNSIYRLELMDKRPANPMINSGAIAVSGCITGTQEQRIDKLLHMARQCLGVSEVSRDTQVFQCEVDTGHRNRALAHMMRDNGVLDGPVEPHLELYYHACSILVDCTMLSYFGALLANGGVVPGGSIRILSAETARLRRTLMSTCGLYDHTGQFAWQVGLPAKSGSAGGIMAAVPGKMGIGTFSPLLDSAGNSVCGIKMLEHLSRELSLYVY